MRSQFVALWGGHVGENDDIRNKGRRAEQPAGPASPVQLQLQHCCCSLCLCCQGSQILLHLENNISSPILFHFSAGKRRWNVNLIYPIQSELRKVEDESLTPSPLLTIDILDLVTRLPDQITSQNLLSSSDKPWLWILLLKLQGASWDFLSPAWKPSPDTQKLSWLHHLLGSSARYDGTTPVMYFKIFLNICEYLGCERGRRSGGRRFDF